MRTTIDRFIWCVAVAWIQFDWIHLTINKLKRTKKQKQHKKYNITKFKQAIKIKTAMCIDTVVRCNLIRSAQSEREIASPSKYFSIWNAQCVWSHLCVVIFIWYLRLEFHYSIDAYIYVQIITVYYYIQSKTKTGIIDFNIFKLDIIKMLDETDQMTKQRSQN